jgi:hypothetical protein
VPKCPSHWNFLATWYRILRIMEFLDFIHHLVFSTEHVSESGTVFILR